MNTEKIHFYAYETFCEAGVEERPDSGELLQNCRRLALDVQQVLNIYNPASELSVLCGTYKPERRHKISPLLFSFLELNLWMARRCMGAFDPTLGPVIRLWELYGSLGRVPKEAAINEALLKTGYRHIHLYRESNEVMIDIPGMIIHPGASGKGFALDKVAAYLRREEVRRGYLNFGGNIYVLGDESFRVGIRHPAGSNGFPAGNDGFPAGLMAVIPIKNQALSTSSWYEHYFEAEGKTYGHIIKPLSGYPPVTEFSSVSTVSENAAVGDILSTALYVLGKAGGDVLMERFRDVPGIAASYIAMDTCGRIVKSPGFPSN